MARILLWQVLYRRKAKTAPVTKERIAYQMEKLGGTSYVATEIHVNSSPNAFIPIGNLNDVRRKAIDELERQEQKRKLCH